MEKVQALDYIVMTMPIWLPPITIGVGMAVLDYHMNRVDKGYSRSESLSKVYNCYINGSANYSNRKTNELNSILQK